MRYAPRWRGDAPGRKDGLYYEDFCCQGCFWDWGHAFAAQHMYKHDSTESNYLGYLKKNWKSSRVDYFADTEESYE